jgi:hypothetical protein
LLETKNDYNGFEREDAPDIIFVFFLFQNDRRIFRFSIFQIA